MDLGSSLLLCELFLKHKPGIPRDTPTFETLDILVESAVVRLAEEFLKLGPGLWIQTHAVRPWLSASLLGTFLFLLFSRFVGLFCRLSRGCSPLLEVLFGSEPDDLAFLIYLIYDKVTEAVFEGTPKLS